MHICMNLWNLCMLLWHLCILQHNAVCQFNETMTPVNNILKYLEQHLRWLILYICTSPLTSLLLLNCLAAKTITQGANSSFFSLTHCKSVTYNFHELQKSLAKLVYGSHIYTYKPNHLTGYVFLQANPPSPREVAIGKEVFKEEETSDIPIT